MKKLIITLIFSQSFVFAACPIDSTACVADMETNLPPTLQQNTKSLFQSDPNAWKFVGTPEAVKPTNSAEKASSSRTFGPTSQDYGYNATCQFGVCRNTGTPRSILNLE